MGPCGSINSNAADMVKWLMTWLHEGECKNRIILPPKFCSQAMATQWGNASSPSSKIQSLGYGLGWNISIYQGHYSVFHGGNTAGSASVVLFLPAEKIGLAVFINSRTSPVPMIIANYITDKLLNLPVHDWSAGQLEVFRREQKKYEEEYLTVGPSTFPPTHRLEDYCGTYSHPGYGSLTINRQGADLVGRYGGQKMLLKHVNYDAFRAILYRWEDVLGKIDVNNRPAVFHQDPDGGIYSFSVLWERNARPIEFVRQAE
jgi:CubicO group peptidase (beta-lactamase class C family)